MKSRTITTITALPKPATFKDAGKAILRVAAYARVSTDHDDQQTSLEAQRDYYTNFISEHVGWEFVRVYVDEGISGLGTKQRDGFNQMIADCLSGEIDMVLTKSISRFARNTVDSVSTIRKLKEKGIAVYFEKEKIYTMDSKGEFLLTLMSSLAQEESRSISENVTWGQRKRMADGKVSLGYSRFLGYDQGTEKFQMVVNQEQAAVVRRLFFLFLKGYTPNGIAQILTQENVPSPGGLPAWSQQTVRRILSNEKYKGDALLQKEFTVDFLQKKMKKNEGEVPQYYVENDHEAIISPQIFDYVQELLESRKTENNCGQRYSGGNGFNSKIKCGACGRSFGPRPWHSTSLHKHTVWQCPSRAHKGPNCAVPNIYDELLHYVIHDAARSEAYERNVLQTVAEIVIAVIGENNADRIRQWAQNFRSKSAWEMFADEDDLAIAIWRITVMSDKKLRIRWLDGAEFSYALPHYSPSKGIAWG